MFQYMQKIKGLKKVLSCPLVLHVFNVILEKRTHFHFESNLQAMLDACAKRQHASRSKKQNGSRNKHRMFSSTIHWIRFAYSPILSTFGFVSHTQRIKTKRQSE